MTGALRTTRSASAKVLSPKPSEEFRPPPCLVECRSTSAPVSPITPCWTPPRRRRVQSAEAMPTWLDFHMALDIVKNEQGLREVRCHLHWWGHDAQVAILLQRLIFWAAVFMLIIPASAFQMMPRMPTLPARAPTSQSVFAIPQRAHLLENITALQGFPGLGTSPAAMLAAATNIDESVALADSVGSQVVSESLSESLSEDLEYELIDQCLLDAASDDDLAACMRQMHASSLDELSGLIVREGCDAFQEVDDGTVVGLLGQVLHTAKEEGLQAISLRRLALKACVSASLHKLTVCAVPALSCMMHLAPDALHAAISAIN